MLSDFADELVIMCWDIPGRIPDNKVIDTDSTVRYISVRDFFEKNIGIEEYEAYVSFLTGIIIEFQEFIGAKSAPKLSPFSMGSFRFEVEKNILTYTKQVREYISADEKISQMHLDSADGISYGYRIIDEENKTSFQSLEDNTKKLISKVYAFFIALLSIIILQFFILLLISLIDLFLNINLFSNLLLYAILKV